MPIADSEVTKGGMTDQEVFNPPPSMARAASDWATSAIRGLVKGGIGLAGMAGDVNEAVDSLINKGAGAVGIKARATPLLPTTSDLSSAVERGFGKFKKPETAGGEYAEAIGEFIPGMAGGEGSLVRKGLQAVGGGAGSQAAGDAASAVFGEGGKPYGQVAGGMLGQGLPGMIRRAVEPVTVASDIKRDHVNTLRAEGVNPTAGQATGSKALKYAESALGEAPFAGGATEHANNRIGEEFTQAALRRVGENARRATPEVVDRAFDRIGGEFDRLAAQNSARIDQPFLNDIFQHQDDYRHLFVDPLRKPIVQDVIDHSINQLVRSQTMTGEQYQAITSRLERMRRGTTDPEIQHFLGDVRRSMDDMMERSIRQHNPDDLGGWQRARQQYRNMLIIENAAVGAGEAAAEGLLSPAKLRQALVNQSKRGYARGQGDYADLVRAGESVLKPLPQSGTANRAHALAVPAGLGAGAVLGAEGRIPEAVAAALAPAVPGVAGRAIHSRPAQAYLGGTAPGQAQLRQLLEQLGVRSPRALDAILRSALAQHAEQPYKGSNLGPLQGGP